MEPIYVKAESMTKPTEIEFCKHTVFIRKNITSEERTDPFGDVRTYWTYDEAKMAPEEFNKYVEMMSARNAINGKNDSDNIISLLSGQSNGDNNQLIIMEAIADLYDVIAGLM